MSISNNTDHLKPGLKKALIVTLLLVIAAGLGLTLWLKESTREPESRTGIPMAALIGNGDDGFARADTPWHFTFPNDHGAHPAYRTESWYFTGHLATKKGRHFGFQLTFFRLALTPSPPQSTSAWATNQVYRAHFALTDVAQNRIHAFERFSRAALDLSGARTSPVRVWLDNWMAEVTMDGDESPGFHLRAAEDDAGIDLYLQSIKPALLQGDNDLLQGNGNARGAFHFYLMTRLIARGALHIGSETFDVEGTASLDRAWGAVPVSRGQIALNRFVLQLDDGREILCFQLHRRDGSGTPVNTGLLVARDGLARSLGRRDVTIEVLDSWSSSRDSAQYPAHWRLSIPSEKLELDITPYVADQELDVSVRYWGGTVRITGKAGKQTVSGNGYVELTGYADGAISI